MRVVAPTAALFAALAVAGCGSSGGRMVPTTKVAAFVLSAKALPHFSSFYVGKQTGPDVTSSLRADPKREGRKAGWIARFHRSGTPKTAGPLVIESRADVFAKSSGAKTDLDAYRVEFNRLPNAGRHDVTLPQIGDEAVGITFVQGGSVRVRFYKIAWRYRNVDASITVDGFEPRVSLADAVALARKQQRAIAAA